MAAWMLSTWATGRLRQGSSVATRTIRQVGYTYVSFSFGQTIALAVPYDATRTYLSVYPTQATIQWGVTIDPNAAMGTYTYMGGFAGSRGYFELNYRDSPELVNQAWYVVNPGAAVGNLVIVLTVRELTVPDRSGDSRASQGGSDGDGQLTPAGEADSPDPVTTWTQTLKQIVRRFSARCV